MCVCVCVCDRVYSMQCELDHDNEVSCLDLNSAATKVVSGTVDGTYIL